MVIVGGALVTLSPSVAWPTPPRALLTVTVIEQEHTSA
jgi:hypothetical protein